MEISRLLVPDSMSVSKEKRNLSKSVHRLTSKKTNDVHLFLYGKITATHYSE